MQPSLRHIRHNIITFTIVGLVFYIWAIIHFIGGKSDLNYNPLYYYGAFGLIVSPILGAFSYFYYRYQKILILRTLIYSAIVFFIWYFGVFIIGGNLFQESANIAIFAWIGLLSVMFFMGIGAINALLGYWIAIFNIAITVYTLYFTHEISPAIWVSIMSIMNIHNPYAQWAVVAISSLMAISEKGMELLDLG